MNWKIQPKQVENTKLETSLITDDQTVFADEEKFSAIDISLEFYSRGIWNEDIKQKERKTNWENLNEIKNSSY